MKVYISNYRDHWISPYTIINYLFFWTKWSRCGRHKGYIPDAEYVDHPEWVARWAYRIEPVSYAIQRILNFIYPAIQYVKIDRWDTYSMDHTLAYIVLPMLRQLRNDKMGSGYVDDEDVPEELRGSREDQVHERWNYVLDEMIFAFETKLDENAEDKFYDNSAVDQSANIVAQIHQMDTDFEGLKDFHQRVTNGFRLFGKYYEGLWS